MKKILCLLTVAAFVFLCGCQNVAEYSSGFTEDEGSYYTTSIVGTFESEEATSSDTSSKVSSKAPSSSVSVSSKPEKVSSKAPSGQSSSSKPAKPSSSEKQSSQATSSDRGPAYTPSGSVTYYYYERLSDGQKALYNTISNAVKNMVSGMVELGSCSNEDISLAFNAVRSDHPEYFWIPSSYVTEISGSKKFVAFDYQSDDYSVSYTCSRSERDSMQAALKSKIDKIRSAVFKNGIDVYELELNLHDYICNNVTYVTEGELINTAYGALVNGKALCEGYSRAMQLLCQEFKIPVTLVCGKATDPQTKKTENHMWNVVQLDKEWYHVDATWDDADEHGISLHNYFNMTDKVIYETHTADPDFKETSSADIKDGKGYNFYLPKCTANKYNFYIREKCTLKDDGDSSRSIITEILRKTAKEKKKYCEFRLPHSPGNSINANTIEEKYALLENINMVNSNSASKINTSNVGIALSGQTFIVFLEYEVE